MTSPHAAGEYQRVDNVFAQGGRVPGIWATIGAPLSAAALAGWGGDVGIAAGAKKADDACRAMGLAQSGVEHYRKGYVDTGLSELREAYQIDSESPFIRKNLGTVLNNVGVQRYQAGNRDGGLPLVKEACGLGIEEGCRAAETMGR